MYKYMDDLLQLDSYTSPGHKGLPQQMQTVHSPLQWQVWDRCLKDHPDQRFRRYIVEGIKSGFRVGFNGLHTRSASNNMLSAMEKPEVIRDYLAKECSEGRVLGPLDPTQFPEVHVSCFGVIPKGTTGKWRLILDMSAPEGASVNDGIDGSLTSLSYVGIQDAAAAVVDRGQGTLLAKVDIKSAYRNIPVHPDDRWLMGMLWDGFLYIDTALPFGLRSAPKIFTAVADAVGWVAKQEGAGFVIHYLDDFLVVGAPNSVECRQSLETLPAVFNRLGLPMAMEKQEGPSTSLDFLGFTLDTQSMMVQLPPGKLTELVELLQQWRGHKSCTCRELESLAGKLAHAARVVQPGKTFMGRIFQLLGGVRQAHHRACLNLSFRSNIEWWYTFIEGWNGVSLMKPGLGTRQSVHIWTDASGHFGCAAYVPATGEWLQAQWPHTYTEWELQLRDESIALQELLPIVLACGVWGSEWKNRTVAVHCDNLGVVALVNSGYSRVPGIMHILRCLFFIRARFQLEVWQHMCQEHKTH